MMIRFGGLAVILLIHTLARADECKLPQPASHIDHNASLASDIVNVKDRLKSEKQVNHWMSCFSLKPELNAKFESEYSGYISRAATAYGLPYPLLACLFFTESKWDANASSGVGAIGVAQLMMDKTVPAINKIISWEDQTESLDARKATHLAEMKRRKLSRSSEEYKTGMAALEAEYELNEARVRAKDGWTKYWDDKKAPKILKKDDLKKPERAIAAGALYLKFILLKYDFGGISPLTRMLLAAGAYNNGPTGAMGVFARAKRASYQAVLDQYRSEGNTETPDHMENLRNCMQNGRWMPGDEKDPRKCKAV